MTKINPINGNEIRSDIFHWSQILEYFNEFYKGHVSISMQK